MKRSLAVGKNCPAAAGVIGWTLPADPADVEVVGGISDIDLPGIELLQDLLKEWIGQAFCQLFFYNPEWNQPPPPWSRDFVGLRYAQSSLIPRPRGDFHIQNTGLLLNSQPSPFVPAPTPENSGIVSPLNQIKVPA